MCTRLATLLCERKPIEYNLKQTRVPKLKHAKNMSLFRGSTIVFGLYERSYLCNIV